MIRVNYHLTEGQHERLKAMAGATGLSVAELIRRAVDAMIDKADRDEARKAGK